GQLPRPLQELVPVANARAGGNGARTLSERTLKRWRSDFAAGGPAALVPADTRAPTAPAGWEKLFLRLYRIPSKPSIRETMEQLAKRLPEGVDMPSYEQVRRFLGGLGAVERNRGRMGSGALLALKGHKRRSTAGLRPMQVVTADGHNLKMAVAHPVHGRPFTPEVVTMLDSATRRIVGWSTGIAEASHVTLDALRRTVELNGTFDLFYTDNGSGFVSDVMDGEVLGHLARLDITHDLATPGRAQARGKIERLQAMWKRAARRIVTYRGHDMDQEALIRINRRIDKAIKQTGKSDWLMPWDTFMAWAQAAVDDYNARPHSKLPRIIDPITGKSRGMSPDEAWQKHLDDGWQPHMEPPAALEDMFRPYEERTVIRCEVSLPWGRYFSRDLEHWHKERVRVGYDVHDGSRVWVRTLDDGRLIAVAERDGNVIPEAPASKLEHAAQQRAKGQIKRLDRYRDEALAALPNRLSGERPAPEPAPQERLMISQSVERLKAEMSAPAPAQSQPQTPKDRYRKALAVQAAREAGRPVDAADLQWLERYQKQSEFRVQQELHQDFGGAYVAETA
ncbi:MAG: Mu transposase C-terminal domain-containing protein, partial [Caenispirillum sp.]|nr:Mu transposase C-terminal domain-containing protein [Caenispirillum sp.]